MIHKPYPGSYRETPSDPFLELKKDMKDMEIELQMRLDHRDEVLRDLEHKISVHYRVDLIFIGCLMVVSTIIQWFWLCP